MGATKKVLWALVLVATVDLVVGKHMAGGSSAGVDTATQENKASHHERGLAAAARPEMLPSKAFAQKR